MTGFGAWIVVRTSAGLGANMEPFRLSVVGCGQLSAHQICQTAR